MKNLLILFVMILLPAAFGACGRTASSTESALPPPPAGGAAPAGTPAQPAGAESKGPAVAPVVLSGVYTISEVEDKGVVKMWPPDNKIEFIFHPDGTYARRSMIRGRVDHADTGKYRVEGGKQLVLSIVSSDNVVQNPAKEIRHTIDLSADAETLKMTAKDGKSALFRKTGEAPGS
ncbi:MAG TPA: hypothetical protein VE262_08895 [Blastocatellia bacterium]|nr:hypothetical protein [Blastocatellia bacterium]